MSLLGSQWFAMTFADGTTVPRDESRGITESQWFAMTFADGTGVAARRAVPLHRVAAKLRRKPL